ncbi:hypothetical protein RI367_001403 [Sorochytrium milnesiophthora]
MSLQAFVGGGGNGADCGPVNPLASLKQQYESERFQDGYHQQGSSSQSLADGFIRVGHAGPQSLGGSSDMFSFDAIGKELPATAKTGDWASDFARFQHRPSHSALLQQQQDMARFDLAFQQAQQQQQQQHPAAERWAHEFASGPFQQPQISAETHAALDQAFEQARAQPQPQQWAQEFGEQQEQQQQHDSWANEFAQQSSTSDGDQLARTADSVLQSIETDDPRFSRSEFMEFMRKLRDREVVVEGDKVVQNTQPGGSWADEFERQVDGDERGQMWASSFAHRLERDWAEDFDAMQQQQQPADSSSVDASLSAAFERAMAGGGTTTDDWVREYERTMKEYSAAQHDAEAEDGGFDADFGESWDQAMMSAPMSPRYQATAYEFERNNVYAGRPVSELKQLDHAQLSLASSILALEAIVQQDDSDAVAWCQLGTRQQENEREAQAISALRRAVEVDPNTLDAWLALSVSYTNENMVGDAHHALESWLAHHSEYKHLVASSPPATANNAGERMVDLFIDAAQLRPEHDLDADVQVGLGVLFNLSEEYAKAVDCFEAALRKRPTDYVLWNKLGATLANSRESTRAIDAYFHALHINPSYIRARYNLAVSCINMTQYSEAVHHLLQALSLQQQTSEQQSVGGGVSGYGLWESLRMACLMMDREDLVVHCDAHNLDAFRGEFDF